MQMHYLSGDRTTALRQYELCAAALEEELGVKPDRETQHLFESMRSDQMENYQTTLSAIPAATSLGDLLQRLQQLSATLTETKRRLQREIDAVQESLRALKQ